MVLASLQVFVPLITFQGFLPSQRLPSLGTEWSNMYLFTELSIINSCPELGNSQKVHCIKRVTCLEISMLRQPHIFMGAIKLCCQRDKLM